MGPSPIRFYKEQVLPRLLAKAMNGAAFGRLRARATDGLEGDVVEIGFGAGGNVPYYPASVARVRAVEPSEVGRRLAARRIAASAIPVELVGLDGEHLPLDDASADHVLSTWTLCTIPGVSQALAEVHRVLRPGGTFHFMEHGLSPDARVARWQHRLTPLQRRVFDGCHLDRPIDALVAAAGFEITSIETFYLRGPKPMVHLFHGIATKG